MATSVLNSYADVQAMFNKFVSDHNTIHIGDAPHADFWNSLTYDQFVDGNVPGVDGDVKILVKGDPDHSNIITILRGTLTLPSGDAFPRMPEGGPFMTTEIDSLADWIKRNCPQ